MGAHHARVFSRCDGANLAGVYDTQAAASARVAAAADTQPFTSLEDAVEAADLVVVATPIDTHRSIAQRALLAGRAVLVEKPLCASAAEAHALVATAHRAARRLFVAHSERFNPVIVALGTQLEGERVREVELSRLAPPRGRVLDHGVCINLAVHDVDLAALLLGAPLGLVQAEGHDAAATLHLTCSDGRPATVHASQVATERVRRVRVVTEGHVFEGDLLRGSLLRDGQPLSVSGQEALLAQAHAVLSALEGHAARCASGADGAAAVGLVDEAARQLRERPRVAAIAGP